MAGGRGTAIFYIILGFRRNPQSETSGLSVYHLRRHVPQTPIKGFLCALLKCVGFLRLIERHREAIAEPQIEHERFVEPLENYEAL
jgi:hypothetical protein